jgi:hypothetical protein
VKLQQAPRVFTTGTCFKYTLLKPCAKYIGKIIIIKKNKKNRASAKREVLFPGPSIF